MTNGEGCSQKQHALEITDVVRHAKGYQEHQVIVPVGIEDVVETFEKVVQKHGLLRKGEDGPADRQVKRGVSAVTLLFGTAAGEDA